MGKSNTTPTQIQKELKGMNYPASKQDLLDHIDNNGKNKEVHSLLEQIPDKEYNSPVEVNKEIGQLK